jgi:signal transduction histidine kinase
MKFHIPEEYYTTLFEALPDKSLLVKADAPRFTILAAAPAYLKQTGYTKEAVTGKGFFEAFPLHSDPAYTGTEELRLSFLHALHQKEPHHLSVQRYDGWNDDGSFTEKYWQISNSPVISPEGEVAYIIHTSKSSEGKYQSLFKSMDQGFCVMEMIFNDQDEPIDYLFLDANPVFELQSGLENVVGKTARQLVPNLEQHWFELYGKVAKEGNALRFIEGSEAMGRWFEVYAFRVEDGTRRKVAVLFTDISKRKQAEDAFASKDQQLRNIIHAAPVPMLILRGEDMVVEMINERMREMIGKKTSLLGKPLLESIPELKDQPGYNSFLKVYQTGEAEYGNEVLVPLMRNGVLEDRYFNFAYTAIIENGVIAGVMDVATEVTEQVLARQKIEDIVTARTKELAEANEALLMVNKELQRSNQNLEEFAHAASHDLKEPVRKINFYTQLLKKQLTDRLKEAETRSFNRIENAAQRMASLIDDLLLYSHVSQRPHEAEKVDLADKARWVLEDLDLHIHETGAEIHVGQLPVVMGYPRQLQQLLQNLVSNALKYGKADVPPRVDITSSVITENNRSFDVIEVRDNGIGFEQEYADKIFQMFVRLHGRDEYNGTGVGLSIVKKVTENHHGFIRAESSPGQGASFKVFLPR